MIAFIITKFQIILFLLILNSLCFSLSESWFGFEMNILVTSILKDSQI